MGSMYTGIATPTEAAGVGAIGALAMAIPRLKLKDFGGAMAETARTTALIFAIVAGVLIYVHFLGFTGMPAAISEWIVRLEMPIIVVLILILCLYLVLGMFLDGIGMILLTVPIILPTIKQLGVDPIVFGVLVVRMVEIGLMTPPVGLNVYVLKGVAPHVRMGDIFRGCGWFVFVDIINVAILLAFPAIILLIPSTMIR
jgi:TRAP-type C4-dicarboxylate transport system permease large subunit